MSHSSGFHPHQSPSWPAFPFPFHRLGDEVLRCQGYLQPVVRRPLRTLPHHSQVQVGCSTHSAEMPFWSPFEGPPFHSSRHNTLAFSGGSLLATSAASGFAPPRCNSVANIDHKPPVTTPQAQSSKLLGSRMSFPAANTRPTIGRLPEARSWVPAADT